MALTKQRIAYLMELKSLALTAPPAADTPAKRLAWVLLSVDVIRGQNSNEIYQRAFVATNDPGNLAAWDAANLAERTVTAPRWRHAQLERAPVIELLQQAEAL